MLGRGRPAAARGQPALCPVVLCSHGAFRERHYRGWLSLLGELENRTPNGVLTQADASEPFSTWPCRGFWGCPGFREGKRSPLRIKRLFSYLKGTRDSDLLLPRWPGDIVPPACVWAGWTCVCGPWEQKGRSGLPDVSELSRSTAAETGSERLSNFPEATQWARQGAGIKHRAARYAVGATPVSAVPWC